MATTALALPERLPPEAVRARAAPLTGALRIELDPPDRDGWIGQAQFADPDAEPFAALYSRFAAAGFGSTRRAAAASLLLRYGWAAGFQIAAWLEHGAVLHLDRYALKFSASTLIEAVWAQELRIEQPADPAEGRAALLASLIAFAEPLVASQHAWSRFSRHALWSMVVSSWAAQFAAIGERLGQRDAAVAEAQALFALSPQIAHAAPQTYVVSVGRNSRVCQVRAACCLYYKGPAKQFCVSCPIIPREERLARNREFTCPTG